MRKLWQRFACWLEIGHKFPVQPDCNSPEYPYRLLDCEHCGDACWVWNRPKGEPRR